MTSSRLAVLDVISQSCDLLSFTQVRDRLVDHQMDQATIYRNLIKLWEAGLTNLVSRVDGIDRYALAKDAVDHTIHPYFLCQDCGRVECLDADVIACTSANGPWSESIREAIIQLSGGCPDCIAHN